MNRPSQIFGALNPEDYSESLSLQVEAYHHIQSQALRILRTVIAIVGIGVAIISVINFGVPQTETSLATWNVLMENFRQDFGEKHLSLALLFLVISALLFIEAVFHLAVVLRSSQPVPFLGKRNTPDAQSSRGFVAWGYSNADEFPEYIASNSELLARMSLSMDKAYSMLTGAVIFVVVAAIIATISITRPGSLLVFVDSILLVIFPFLWGMALFLPSIFAYRTISRQDEDLDISDFYKSYIWSNDILPNVVVTVLIGYVWFKLIQPYMTFYRDLWNYLPI